MKKEKIHQLYEWLLNMDSHDIYDETFIMEIGGGFTYGAKDGTLTDNDDPDNVCKLPLTTAAEQNQAIEARGLGGNLVTGKEGGFWHFVAFAMAESIAVWVLGHNPGGMYGGRGKRFRACLQALKKEAE